MGNAAQLRRHATETVEDRQVDQSQERADSEPTEAELASRESFERRTYQDWLTHQKRRERLEAYFPFGKPARPPTPQEVDQMAEGFFASDRESKA
jgi:hypothetical protein